MTGGPGHSTGEQEPRQTVIATEELESYQLLIDEVELKEEIAAWRSDLIELEQRLLAGEPLGGSSTTTPVKAPSQWLVHTQRITTASDLPTVGEHG